MANRNGSIDNRQRSGTAHKWHIRHGGGDATC
jgi:hypothetical protein